VEYDGNGEYRCEVTDQATNSNEDVYTKAPVDKVVSLQAFLVDDPTSTLTMDGLNWEYLAVGKGPQTIVFLHGMTSSYDIWWQQIEAFQGDCRVIAMTYPAAGSLEELKKGVLATLDREGVTKFNL